MTVMGAWTKPGGRRRGGGGGGRRKGSWMKGITDWLFPLLALTSLTLITSVLAGIPPKPSDCQDEGPAIDGGSSFTWCRVSERQCAEFCRGQNNPYYLLDGQVCTCSARQGTSVADIPLAQSCSELYFNHYVFASGQYVIDPDHTGSSLTVLCQTEDRELCNGSLIHGASGHLDTLHDDCMDSGAAAGVANPTDAVNRLSPYVYPHTDPYSMCHGNITVKFRHKVVIHGLYTAGSGFSTLRLSYTYTDTTMTEWTRNTTYQYRHMVYGDPTTVTVTPGSYQSLRAFVADSVTLWAVDTPNTAQMKLDLFGCKFDSVAENTIPSEYSAWSCYHWPRPKVGDKLYKSSDFTRAHQAPGTDYITIFPLHQYQYWSLAQQLPLGRPLDESGCDDRSSSCSFMAFLLDIGGQLQCGWVSQFASDLENGYMDVVSGNVGVGCTEDGHQAWRTMKKKMESSYYSKCPEEGPLLYQMNYDKHIQSVEACAQVKGEEGVKATEVSRSFTLCQQTADTGDPTFLAPLYRNLFFQCNDDYDSVLSSKFDGTFVEATHEGMSVNRRTVGQISEGYCMCPHTTSGQDENRQKFICSPDFTYDLITFLGCETITCKTPPAPAPAAATMSWNQETTYKTVITYTCNENFLFETSGWPSSVASTCGCSSEWRFQGDTLPPTRVLSAEQVWERRASTHTLMTWRA